MGENKRKQEKIGGDRDRDQGGSMNTRTEMYTEMKCQLYYHGEERERAETKTDE